MTVLSFNFTIPAMVMGNTEAHSGSPPDGGRPGSADMIEWKQADMGFGTFGVKFANPDFVKYAESYGATGHRIQRSEDFTATLEQAFTAGGVHLIDLPVDYSQNGPVLLEEIPRVSAELDLG